MDLITLILIIIVVILAIAMVIAFIKMKMLINEAQEQADKMNEEDIEAFSDENFSV